MIDDGTKTIVLGVALPGLQESLNISKDKLDIPNSIEITMDATDFEMGSIMNYVTPKLLEDEEIVGYMKLVNDEPKLTFITSGINETIFKYVSEEITQTSNIIKNLAEEEIKNKSVIGKKRRTG